MKQPEVNKLAEHYSAILRGLGAALQTPTRAAKALVEVTEAPAWRPMR